MDSVSGMKVEVHEERDEADSTMDQSSDEEDPNEGEEYVDEEMLVFADFEKYLAIEELTDPNVRIKVIGVEAEHPIIQINNDVYKGTYDYPMGTNVFLEEDAVGKAASDPLYGPDPQKVYKYFGQSSKVLKMKRIFVTPKADETVGIKPEPGEEKPDVKLLEAERYQVTRNYEEALNLHLPEGCYPPRHIDLDQNCDKVVRQMLTTLTMEPSDGEEDGMQDDPDDADYDPVLGN